MAPPSSHHDDSMRLQQAVAAALMQQVELGALYMSKCPAEMGSSHSHDTGAPMPQRTDPESN